MDDRAAAEDRPALRNVPAPAFVGELLVVGDAHVGAVHPDGHVAGHLIGATDEGEAVAAVEVAVPLPVPVLALQDHLDRVEASCRYESGRLAVGVWEVRVYDVSALGVGLVGPVLRVVSMGPPISASDGPSEQNGITGCFEAPQDHVAHEVLPVLLRGVDDVVALARDARLSREVPRRL